MMQALSRLEDIAKTNQTITYSPQRESQERKNLAKSALDYVDSSNADKLHFALVVGGTNTKMAIIPDNPDEKHFSDDSWAFSFDNSDGFALQRVLDLISFVANHTTKNLDAIIAWAGIRQSGEAGSVTRQNVSVADYDEKNDNGSYKALPLANIIHQALESQSEAGWNLRFKAHEADKKADWVEHKIDSQKSSPRSFDVFFGSDLLMKGLEQTHNTSSEKPLRKDELDVSLILGTGFNVIFSVGQGKDKEPKIVRPYSGTELIQDDINYDDWNFYGKVLEPFRNPKLDTIDYWFAGGRDDNPYMGIKATANYLSGRLNRRHDDGSEGIDTYPKVFREPGAEISPEEVAVAKKLIHFLSPDLRENIELENLVATFRKSKLMKESFNNGEAFSNRDILELARENQDQLALLLSRNLAYRMGRFIGSKYKKHLPENTLVRKFRFTSSNAVDMFDKRIPYMRKAFAFGFNQGINQNKEVIALRREKRHKIFDAQQPDMEGVSNLLYHRYNFNKHFGDNA
jgi:hypothetical protein